MSEGATSILMTRGLERSFTQGDVTIEVLRGVDLAVAPGEIVQQPLPESLDLSMDKIEALQLAPVSSFQSRLLVVVSL